MSAEPTEDWSVTRVDVVETLRNASAQRCCRARRTGRHRAAQAANRSASNRGCQATAWFQLVKMHNEESNVCVFDRALAGQLRGIFLDDLAACERVTLERWTRRGAWARAQEFVASFLQEQA